MIQKYIPFITIHTATTPVSCNSQIFRISPEYILAAMVSCINNMVEMTGAKRCGVSEVDNMSGINWCTIPVTIVEMGFMSNVAEDNNMATESYRNLLVKGMANGIDEYFGY